MKKIGILTINDDGNFGNRLQNYALQEVLKKKNLKVETILNQKGIHGINYIKKYIKTMIKVMLPLKKFERYKKFRKFNREFIKFSRFKIEEEYIPKELEKKYDFFVTGSDQVWNPTFGRMSDIDFLTFAPKEKRNSFSASFGISDIPEELKDYYRERLQNLNKISVREERGKEIVENLTGRKDVEVLLDPTMLLQDKEWDKVLKKPKNLKEQKYILTYFLGEISINRKKEIERIARENNCIIINMLDRNSEFYANGPSEFLYLEKNAFLICTDSFHSCVFAIIYNRPFIVFDREDKLERMNSRIDTLLNKFELKDRRYKGKITQELLRSDYEKYYEKIKVEREKAEKFLDKLFSTEE